jgi:hypothetical protein
MEVKVRVKVCGICGTDLHEYNNGPFLIPSRPHPLTGLDKGPVILGHEFSGEIVECGEGVSDYSKGDRITVNPLIYCGQCAYCKEGQWNMCIKLGTRGLAAHGGFAEYMVPGFEHGIGMMGDEWRIGLNDGPFSYWTNPDHVYQAGEMVICAMQYACPEEEIGFRYENPILITAEGCEAMSKFPLGIEEI